MPLRLSSLQDETQDADFAAQRLAMSLSLGVGVGLFFLKGFAYFLTGSTAILSDVAESVVHLPAIGIAAFCLWVSQRPEDRRYPYGYERASYFSAGLEGALIILAALYIIYESTLRLLYGFEMVRLEMGSALIGVATILNGLLGLYLVQTGKRRKSLVLIANGKHVLADSYTSLGVVLGLIIVAVTGLRWMDPLIALFVSANIIFAGWKLVRESIFGLMDEIDPELDGRIRAILVEASDKHLCTFHELRHRNTGRTTWIEVHLLFPGDVTIREAHRVATAVEHQIESTIGGRVVVTTHLEPRENHEAEHSELPIGLKLPSFTPADQD